MSLCLFLVLFSIVYPLIFSIDYSLWDTSFFSKVKFVGIQNFIDLLREDRFQRNVYNSFIFTFVGICVSMGLSFTTALVLREPTKINSIYRTLVLIPWVINEVVFALMWAWILNAQLSPVYYWFEKIGIILPDVLSMGSSALWTVTIINGLRSAGFSLIMFLTALAGIPKELEEAAEVDGCSRIGKIRFILIPLMRPITQVMIIVLTISFFNVVALVLNMTGGGPQHFTELISIRLYKEGFKFFNIGTASILTTIMLFVNLFLAWIYKKTIDVESYY